MDFTQTDRELDFQRRVRDFMQDEVRPSAGDYARDLASGDLWSALPVFERLKAKAKAAAPAAAAPAAAPAKKAKKKAKRKAKKA